MLKTDCLEYEEKGATKAKIVLQSQTRVSLVNTNDCRTLMLRVRNMRILRDEQLDSELQTLDTCSGENVVVKAASSAA